MQASESSVSPEPPVSLTEDTSGGSVAQPAGWSAAWVATGGRFTLPMLLLVAFVVGVLLMPLVFFRFQRDQAHFAYVALCWLKGLVPYADLPTHQFPGQLMLYAGIFKLLGVSEIAVRTADLILQVIAGLALAGIVARFTRPLTGFLAAILFALQYVCIDPWNASNRETYQIAFLLPTIYWLMFGSLRPWLDKVAALAAGAVVMLVLLIKPTIGLALLPLAWVIFSPGSSAQPPGVWRRRLPFIILGGVLLAALCGGLFSGHWADAYEFLVTYNVEIYSKALSFEDIRSQLLSSFLFQGLYFIPFVCLVWGRKQRPVLIRLLAIHIGLIVAVLVQGRGFPYQSWVVFPFLLLWTALFIDYVVARTFAAYRGSGEHRWPLLAGMAVFLLVLGIPYGNAATLSSYSGMLADPSLTQGPLAPTWDETITWIHAHVRPGERVFFFGHDTGVQFLMQIPPISRVTTGVLDLRDDRLNAHPLMVRLKHQMMTDLERDPPAWILVAVYDESWFSRSGVRSLHSFRPFADFLLRRYELVKSSQTSYVIFRRRPPARESRGQ
jgi:hypothetical protein